MIRRLALFVIACVAIQTAILGQQGTSSLAGVVVGSSGEPLRKAVVSLGGADDSVRLSAITDDQGQFAFSNLAAGRYGLTVSKPAYLTTEYGARRPGRPGTTITLMAGQQLGQIRLTMVRGAVIAGTIRDQTGAAMPNVSVMITPAALASGISTYALPTEGQVTDDRGAYRAYGLVPGEYIIVAIPTIPAFVARGATVQRPSGELDAEIAALQQRRGRGAGPASGTPIGVRAMRSGHYAPIFYPGTPVAADAGRVRLAAGDVIEGMDISIDLVPSAELEVTVLTGNGLPAPSATVGISVMGPPLPIFSSLQFVGQKGPDHVQTYRNLTPGRYIVLARQDTRTQRPSGETVTVLAGWAMNEALVNGPDLQKLTLTLQPPMSFSGRVAFDAATAAAAPDLASVRVGLARSQGEGSAGFRIGDLPAPKPAVAQADGSFSIDAVFPGRFTLFAQTDSKSGANVWWLKSAVVDGRDLLDAPLEFGTAGGGSVSGALLTLSDRRTELAGRLQSTAGHPAPEYYVIVFSSDRTHWYPGARRTRSARPGTDGEFSFVNLPAGSYRIAALTDVEPGEWQQRSFLEQVVSGSLPVTIAEGARVRQDLQVAP